MITICLHNMQGIVTDLYFPVDDQNNRRGNAGPINKNALPILTTSKEHHPTSLPQAVMKVEVVFSRCT